MPRRIEQRKLLVVVGMAFGVTTSATGQVGVAIGLPGVSIGINLPVHPEFDRVPGFPVYYAPQVGSNYFFYDGMYRVYQGDRWYAGSWYNGPWGLVGPEAVPLYILRVPVRYYRRPPAHFHGWRTDAPPRWGEYWGGTWEQSRSGWDRRVMPAPAPLPVYQRQYSGGRYPHVEQQLAVQSRHYRYQPRDAVVQQHYQAWRAQPSPAPTRPQRDEQAPRPHATVQKHTVTPAPQRQGHADHKPQAQSTPGAAARAQPAGRSQGRSQDRDRDPQDFGSVRGQDEGEPQGRGRSR